MSRCAPTAVLALAFALSACGQDDAPADARQAPASWAADGDIEAEIFPHASAQMPAEGLDPDGRLAPWAMGAQVGATLQALAEACGGDSAARAEEIGRQQRDALTVQGVDMARFDAVWTWAYRQARQKLAMQPRGELDEGCARLREIERDEGGVQEIMQRTAMPPGGG